MGNKKITDAGVFFSLVLALIVLFLVDLATGSVAIPLDQVLHILSGAPGEKASWEKIIWLIVSRRNLTKTFGA